MVDVLTFLTGLRESFYGADVVYTKGSCYELFKILSALFPTADAYYYDKHIYTKIDNVFYDINGIATPEKPEPYNGQFDLHKTKFDLWVQGLECPHCDEIISYHELLKKR